MFLFAKLRAVFTKIPVIILHYSCVNNLDSYYFQWKAFQVSHDFAESDSETWDNALGEGFFNLFIVFKSFLRYHLFGS